MKLFIMHKDNAHPYDGVTYYTQCKTKQAYALKYAHRPPIQCVAKTSATLF